MDRGIFLKMVPLVPSSVILRTLSTGQTVYIPAEACMVQIEYTDYIKIALSEFEVDLS